MFPTCLRSRIVTDNCAPKFHGDSALHIRFLEKAFIEIQAFFGVDFETPPLEKSSQQTRAVQHLSAAGMDIGTWLRWFPTWEFHVSLTICHQHSHCPPCAGSSWCAGCKLIFASWELAVWGWKRSRTAGSTEGLSLGYGKKRNNIKGNHISGKRAPWGSPGSSRSVLFMFSEKLEVSQA